MQREASLVDQEREAREFAERTGGPWSMCILMPRSAVARPTPQFERMQVNANRNAFDIVLSESIDRLSRNLVGTASLHEELSFLGIRLFTIHQGEINEMLVAMMGS